MKTLLMAAVLLSSNTFALNYDVTCYTSIETRMAITEAYDDEGHVMMDFIANEYMEYGPVQFKTEFTLENLIKKTVFTNKEVVATFYDGPQYSLKITHKVIDPPEAGYLPRRAYCEGSLKMTDPRNQKLIEQKVWCTNGCKLKI